MRSLSARRAWIEILDGWDDAASGLSLSARRAWIEIRPSYWPLGCVGVALRKESVDRNFNHHSLNLPSRVALRKESVDRNPVSVDAGCIAGVALRKESVDRNTAIANTQLPAFASLSARRAWIEIAYRLYCIRME